MKCDFCGEDTIYMCGACGKAVCGKHSKLRVVCSSCLRKGKIKSNITRAISEEEKTQIRELIKRFWGEEEQLTFDERFNVAGMPAFVAKADESIAGFVSFVETDDTVILVALGILPQYQDSGIGRDLITMVEAEAKKLNKKRLLVSTSNDDLPALGFYQALGFQIFEVKPDVIAEKHGGVVSGIGGLPVRDEIRLRKNLRQPH
jgi:ribosomal protein S18 acetylase RimI-like enzyme